MRCDTYEFQINTHGCALYDLTHSVKKWLSQLNISTGQITIFCPHTSCSLTIQENADPDVQKDLINFFRQLVPENEPWYRHVLEGPDDMPAHIKSSLTDISLTIPILNGHLALGTWQAIYLFEHRTQPHHRRLILSYMGS